VLELQVLFFFILLFDFERVRIEQRRPSPHKTHGALLRQLAQPAGQLLDDALFPRRELFQVDLGFLEFHAPGCGVTCFIDQRGDVEQRFRRDATAVETHAARIGLGINQRNLEA